MPLLSFSKRLFDFSLSFLFLFQQCTFLFNFRLQRELPPMNFELQFYKPTNKRQSISVLLEQIFASTEGLLIYFLLYFRHGFFALTLNTLLTGYFATFGNCLEVHGTIVTHQTIIIISIFMNFLSLFLQKCQHAQTKCSCDTLCRFLLASKQLYSNPHNRRVGGRKYYTNKGA